jgi:hypothetical protein
MLPSRFIPFSVTRKSIISRRPFARPHPDLRADPWLCSGSVFRPGPGDLLLCAESPERYPVVMSRWFRHPAVALQCVTISERQERTTNMHRHIQNRSVTRSLLSRFPTCGPGGRLEILPMRGGGATPMEQRRDQFQCYARTKAAVPALSVNGYQFQTGIRNSSGEFRRLEEAVTPYDEETRNRQ